MSFTKLAVSALAACLALSVISTLEPLEPLEATLRHQAPHATRLSWRSGTTCRDLPLHHAQPQFC